MKNQIESYSQFALHFQTCENTCFTEELGRMSKTSENT